MKQTTVRNIPDEVYDAIAKVAEMERRSINNQIVIGLEYYAKYLKQEEGSPAKEYPEPEEKIYPQQE